MKIQKANIADTGAIVDLLKLTLGERLLPKSIEYWNWKHFCNPFGRSEILVARFDDKIIGVRAFMRWNWVNDESQINAIRAVDTATHPSYQGKGVFTKLTLSLVHECEAANYDLIFNTPNKKSLSGYKKMGWIDAGKIPILLTFPFSSPRFYADAYVDYILQKYACNSNLPIKNDRIYPILEKSLETSISEEYYNWRYAQCPIINYGVVGCRTDAFVYFRLKKFGKFIELRICDVWRQSDLKQNVLEELIVSLKTEIRPIVVTMAPSVYLIKPRGFFMTRGGPLVTVRGLKDVNLSNYLKFTNWTPSLGSMELF